jgi:hypothetical protein
MKRFNAVEIALSGQSEWPDSQRALVFVDHEAVLA